MARRNFERMKSSPIKVYDYNSGRFVDIDTIPVICDRIRFYRKRKGMEQRELADKVGVSANAISNWEQGRSRPSVELLPMICEALGITMYELYDVSAPASISKSESDFIAVFNQLSDGSKQIVRATMKEMLAVQEAHESTH